MQTQGSAPAAMAVRTAGKMRPIYPVASPSLPEWNNKVAEQLECALAAAAARSMPLPVMPDDFPYWAARESNVQLQARYKMGLPVIRRFRVETGIPSTAKGGQMAEPIPADFATVAANKSIREVALHYGRSREMIRRWFNQTDVPRAPGRPGPRSPRPAATSVPRTPRLVRPNRSSITPQIGSIHSDRPLRDMSAAGQAADYLRKFGAVYRCNANGSPNATGGKFWRRGSVVLTDAELIERAEFNRRRAGIAA